MGSGIAETAAAVSQVILPDVDLERAEAGLMAIEKRLGRQVEKGYIDAARKGADRIRVS